MTREEKQEYFANKWLETKRGILLLTMRFGKTRVGIKCFEKIGISPSILICYPDGQIKQSWINEFEKTGYNNPNVIFTTYRSLHKHNKKTYDVVVLDEIQKLSEKQMRECQILLSQNNCILGLTGTLAPSTRLYIKQSLKLPIIAEYSMEQAINDGIVKDYEIFIVKTPLDNRIKYLKGKTEKEKFDGYSYVINKLLEEGKDVKFLRLKRLSLIKNSIAKKTTTISLINGINAVASIDTLISPRILVFCGTKAIADSLGISSFHSTTQDKSIFQKFLNKEINALAVVKIGNTGITYPNLNCVIINSFDSNSEQLAQQINRAMSLEYIGEKAKIYIVSSTEEVELYWLDKALTMFDKNKIYNL